MIKLEKDNENQDDENNDLGLLPCILLYDLVHDPAPHLLGGHLLLFHGQR